MICDVCGGEGEVFEGDKVVCCPKCSEKTTEEILKNLDDVLRKTYGILGAPSKPPKDESGAV